MFLAYEKKKKKLRASMFFSPSLLLVRHMRTLCSNRPGRTWHMNVTSTCQNQRHRLILVSSAGVPHWLSHSNPRADSKSHGHLAKHELQPRRAQITEMVRPTSIPCRIHSTARRSVPYLYSTWLIGDPRYLHSAYGSEWPHHHSLSIVSFKVSNQPRPHHPRRAKRTDCTTTHLAGLIQSTSISVPPCGGSGENPSRTEVVVVVLSHIN